MCTAVTYRTKDFYFGRTLDYEFSYGEEVVITPRNFPLSFRHGNTLKNHHAILGMAHVAEGYPLYYDAVNEKGLAMAGLNFVENAVYAKPVKSKNNIAQFEFLPWILAQCAGVREVRELLANLNITDTAFSDRYPPAQLHWMIADRNEAITVEAVRDGLRVYDNPVGVLTNNPPFDLQLFNLNNYMYLSPEGPKNLFSNQIDLRPYSRGMGALGLPGDWSSQSRFVRAAFVKLNSVSGEEERESVCQFFHILNSVDQPRGCCKVEDGYERTIYTSCCNADKGIYYFTTYDNHQISAVHLCHTKLENNALDRFPMITGEHILNLN